MLLRQHKYKSLVVTEMSLRSSYPFSDSFELILNIRLTKENFSVFTYFEFLDEKYTLIRNINKRYSVLLNIVRAEFCKVLGLFSGCST